MRTQVFLAGMAAGFLAWTGGAQAGATSRFDAGAEGWTVVTSYPFGAPSTLIGGATWQANGGNPGGHVSTFDPNAEDTYFRAPASFLGNQSAALDGMLSFDRMVTTPAIDYSQPYDIVLQGGGMTLRYDLPLPSAVSLWETYSVALSASAGWIVAGPDTPATLADLQAVLANVTELWLLAEFTNGLVEDTAIDNVVLTDGRTTEVPEPATLLLLAGALGLTVSARRRS